MIGRPIAGVEQNSDGLADSLDLSILAIAIGLPPPVIAATIRWP